MAIGDLTFSIDKIVDEGDQKSVKVIHYTVTGTDDNAKTASIKRTIGFDLKTGSEGGYIPFSDVTEANAIAWVKKALAPLALTDIYEDPDGPLRGSVQGTPTGVDLYSEVEQSLKMEIETEIARVETNLPWA